MGTWSSDSKKGGEEGKVEKERGGTGEREKIERDYSRVTVTMSVSLSSKYPCRSLLLPLSYS